jgi:hypothetical protein
LEPPSTAWVCWDDEALYVAFDNPVDATKPLREGDEWGRDDAVEVALRRAGADDAPIVVLRGFPSGHFLSSDEAGAPADAVALAGKGVAYAARRQGAGRWTAEWRIPFGSLAVGPAAGVRFEANLTVRKTAGPSWIMWRGTGAQSWRVGRSGAIELAD